jgi:amidase
MVVRRLDPNLKPKIKVKQNQTFTLNLINGFGAEVNNHEEFETLLTKKIGHPLDGPVYIDNIKKGDCIEVEIVDIIPNNKGYQCNSRSTGILKGKFKERNYKIFKVENNKIKYSQNEFEIKPSLGYISTLTEFEFSAGRACKNGGNLDFNQLKKGAKIILPTSFDGGMLLAGDMHLLQGNGEVSGIALECSGQLKLKVKKSDQKVNSPLILTKNETLVVGTGYTIEDTTTNALENALGFFSEKLNLTKEVTYLWLSANTNLIFGNFSGKVKTSAIQYIKT